MKPFRKIREPTKKGIIDRQKLRKAIEAVLRKRRKPGSLDANL